VSTFPIIFFSHVSIAYDKRKKVDITGPFNYTPRTKLGMAFFLYFLIDSLNGNGRRWESRKDTNGGNIDKGKFEKSEGFVLTYSRSSYS
jgi:hypothetical protein